MPDQNRTVSPGPNDRTVLLPDRTSLEVPSGWVLLPPGDAALTRRVKAAGPVWMVQKKKGRKTFSLGLWAPEDRILRIREDLQVERSKPSYARKLAAGAARRQREQEQYVEDFRAAVLTFLSFAPCYRDQAEELATRVVAHATPVGSGTVARTQRIPIERRAEAAVIAWLRHQTTGYDHMKIERVKGRRREVRQILAAHSRRLLDRYRQGLEIDPELCPLAVALRK
jgi:hypothetical protein